MFESGRRIALLALLLGLAGAAAPARAETFGLGLGVQGGVIQSRDASGYIGTFGAHARLRLIGIVNAEARASYSKESFEAAGVKVVDIEQIPVDVTVQVYPLPLGPIRPYAAAGWGWTYVKTSGSWRGIGLDSTQTKGNFVAGVGVDLMIYRKIALNADLRYSFSKVTTLEDIGNITGADVRSTPLTATAGLTFYF